MDVLLLREKSVDHKEISDKSSMTVISTIENTASNFYKNQTFPMSIQFSTIIFSIFFSFKINKMRPPIQRELVLNNFLLLLMHEIGGVNTLVQIH